MSDSHRDMPPMHEAQHSFDVVLRGFDRHQVAETVERLEADFRIAIADRDAAVARSADLASQLSAMHGELESVRRKAANAAAPTFENISERIQHMLRLAEEEAGEIRRAAAAEAQAVREQTTTEERALAERHAASQGEVERMLTEARQSAEQIASKAQIRADELVQKAQERVARLDAESQARRAKAEEDFDIAQRARRADAARHEEERERVSQQAARQRVAAAEQQAAQIVAEAEAKAAAIRDVRDELTSRLLQARQLLSTLPDLSDRPRPAGDRPSPQPAGERPSPEERRTTTGPQTNLLTVRPAEGESAAARQPIRQEPPGPTGPATAVQPAVTADQPTGRPSETGTDGPRPPMRPRPSPGPSGGGQGSPTPGQGPPTRVIESPSTPGRH